MTTDRAQQDVGEAIRILDCLELYLPTVIAAAVKSDIRKAIDAARQVSYEIEHLEKRYCERCCNWLNSPQHLECQLQMRRELEEDAEAQGHEDWMEQERKIHSLQGE